MTILELLMDGSTKMAFVGALAAGVSAISGLVGGIASARAANKARQQQQESLNNIKALEQSWYDREYNADALQRADAQRAINMVSEQIRERNRNVAGQAAVGGLTDEAVALQKAQGNQVLADTAADIVARNQARKDAIADRHQANLMQMEQNQMAVNQANAEQKLNNIGMATQAAGSLAGAIASQTEIPNTTTTANTAPIEVNMAGLQQVAATHKPNITTSPIQLNK